MRVVIIGGDAAGMSAAMQIVRNSEVAEITVLEKGKYYSYAQCGLPYYIGSVIDSSEKLIARKRETFQDEYDIDARIFHEVREINPKERTVKGWDLINDKSFEIPYEKCLIATGAAPIFPKWEGGELHGIHVLKTIPDAKHIIKDMKEDVLNVTIIGGGYIGLEVAENMVGLGRKVRIIDMADSLGNVFDKEISDQIHDEAEARGIEVILGESVEGFSGKNKVETVVTDKGTYRSDMVIVAIGVKPNTDFVKNIGLNLHTSGAIIVNPYMETNVENIYAAGDCATQFHRIKELDDYIPLGTHANKQGRVAGSNIAGLPKTFQGIVGTSIMKFFDLTIGRTGLSEAEAEGLHIPYESLEFTGRTHSGYYPNSEKLYIKLLRNKETDRFLGAQIVGKSGVDKRIDVAATALYHEMTISDLENLDLSYAPPFNGVWDPLQQAARRYGNN
ncbi:NADPH-dependent 2,4-dienoyl-CoA reductase/sulfur reductase-like enzyme [Evansella vedderi]|uniref:NADPH-dependent 2,4-dienoyl-CoA reductase/sulfur reductase-like enzyme n=1 Tax=Evansella vedderi TaxID=38282 RepID=A0ABU0A110_9BACI|nr:FAD-dependent oxidoreductase [Evansella vedderi]MDQ0257174.1 NADPH-dependent 2,4-dienoyl-CoA reductase/sulfur reductase-like enzyme [Evansella vedderi]